MSIYYLAPDEDLLMTWMAQRIRQQNCRLFLDSAKVCPNQVMRYHHVDFPVMKWHTDLTDSTDLNTCKSIPQITQINTDLDALRHEITDISGERLPLPFFIMSYFSKGMELSSPFLLYNEIKI